MIGLEQIDVALGKYIRPQSSPLAIRMCRSQNELPEQVKFPKKDLGISVPVCQGIAMARRFGWTLAMGKEDQICPHGHAVLGFVSGEAYLDGRLAEAAGLGPRETFARRARGMSLLEYGRYSHLLVAPIEQAQFEPHFIMLFGNPAQIVRLVQGAVFFSGGSVSCEAEGGRACAAFVAKTMLTERCQIILSGAGDRYFALTQDHEMAFTIPLNEAESTMKGLAQSHKMGLRYPTPSWLRFEGQMPETYYRFTELLLHQS